MLQLRTIQERRFANISLMYSFFSPTSTWLSLLFRCIILTDWLYTLSFFSISFFYSTHIPFSRISSSFSNKSNRFALFSESPAPLFLSYFFDSLVRLDRNFSARCQHGQCLLNMNKQKTFMGSLLAFCCYNVPPAVPVMYTQ